MADFSFQELAQTAGQTTGDFIKDTTNTAADFACSLYRDHRDWLVNQFDPVHTTNPFRTAMMDSLCMPRPGFSPGGGGANPSYTGGQCAGVLYRVSLTAGDQYGDPPVTNTANVHGPILVNSNLLGTSNGKNLYQWTVGENPPGQPGTAVGITGVAPLTVQIVRLDGQPDNCGNPPVPSPTPGELTKNVTINNVPVQIAYVNAHVDVGLNINLGGVNFNFDFRGATINNPAAGQAGAGSQLDDLTAQATAQATAIATVNNSINGIGVLPGTPLTTTDKPPAQSHTSETNPKIKLVCLTLSSIPQNAKEQFGAGADNVIYAGWIEFRRGFYNYPRTPIHFQSCVFAAPPGADGYAYTLYYSFMGHATEISVTT